MPNTFQEEYNHKQVEMALPRLRRVLAWHDKGLGPTEIGKLLDLNRQRAAQLVKKALAAREKGWI